MGQRHSSTAPGWMPPGWNKIDGRKEWEAQEREEQRAREAYTKKIESLVRRLYRPGDTAADVKRRVDRQLSRNEHGRIVVFTPQNSSLATAGNHIAASLLLGISPLPASGFGPILNTNIARRCLQHKPTNKHQCGYGTVKCLKMGMGSHAWCDWVVRKNALATPDQATALFRTLETQSRRP